MKGLLSVWVLGFVFCTLSYGNSHAETKEEIVIAAKDTLSCHILGSVENGLIIISADVDLKGCVCKLPKGITLLFKNGVIRNGTLSGCMTKIECKGKAFDRVTIEGSWNVPEISTRLFADLSYENSLRDVVALAHPKVKNRIVIEKGEYKVSAGKKSATCISLCSNTDLMMNGTIRLVPNGLKSYNIILAKGKNINIGGKGTIIGDKYTHTGTEGEWGMGVRLHKAVNATVSGLTIKDCWGDCIYVGGNSKNVLIENCTLDNGRRQGISITKADSVTIRQCSISNVGGTAPEYAIDIEPNKGDTVDHVLIEKVAVKNCQGGIMATRSLKKSVEGKPLSWIGSVELRCCNTSAKRKFPASFKGCDCLFVSNCKIVSTHANPAIRTQSVRQVRIVENTIIDKPDLLSKAKRSAKKLLQRGDAELISIEGAKIQKVNANRIITK